MLDFLKKITPANQNNPNQQANVNASTNIQGIFKILIFSVIFIRMS